MSLSNQSRFEPTTDLKAIRSQFPILDEVVYLNTGTYGLMPEPALKAYVDAIEAFERGGVACKINIYAYTEAVRKRIAALLKVDVEEIAFSRNATDGSNFVLSGLDWNEGDEVLSTNEEHPSLSHPLLYLQKTKGIKVKWLPLSPKPSLMLAELEKAKTSRTRLVAMSHVPCETGTRIPAKEICKWARENGILSLIDGAQSFAAMPISLRDMGCDFYSSNGHKWLSGPKGSGVFYVRKEHLETLKPAHVGAGSLVKADVNTGEAEPYHSGMRFEFGSRAQAIMAGLEATLDWFDQLGWDNVWQHIERLSDYAKARLMERPDIELLTPVAFNESSGLVSFRIKGYDSLDVATKLRETKRIHTRMVLEGTGIRIATAHYVSPEDIDCLMDTLAEVAPLV
jgi:L-cysteine/cystine lyase